LIIRLLIILGLLIGQLPVTALAGQSHGGGCDAAVMAGVDHCMHGSDAKAADGANQHGAKHDAKSHCVATAHCCAVAFSHPIIIQPPMLSVQPPAAPAMAADADLPASFKPPRASLA